MAQKRMFSRSIIETDYFLDLPDSGKALYFLLGMEADDEGFVSPKRVMRLYQLADDNLKILVLKNFVIPFKSGVVVITDWNENNYLDKNRIKRTKYLKERSLLTLTKERSYVFNNGLTPVKPGEDRIGEERRDIQTTEVIKPKVKRTRKVVSEQSSRATTKVKKFSQLGAEIIKEFEYINPACKTMYANKTQRTACDGLIDEYGFDEVKKRIAVLPLTNKRPRYEFPHVNTPHQLFLNWTKLNDGAEQKSNEFQDKNNKYPVI